MCSPQCDATLLDMLSFSYTIAWGTHAWDLVLVAALNCCVSFLGCGLDLRPVNNLIVCKTHACVQDRYGTLHAIHIHTFTSYQHLCMKRFSEGMHVKCWLPFYEHVDLLSLHL